MTEAFAPIERRKVYEQVSERLTAQIGTALQPGDALPSERELAERYRVGRSSIREALRMLESRGLIESRGSGTFVVAPWRNPFQQPLSLVVAGEDVNRMQLFEVRRMLEAEAAALAARRRSQGDIDLITRLKDAGVVPNARVAVESNQAGGVTIVIPGHENVSLPHEMAHAVKVEKV